MFAAPSIGLWLSVFVVLWLSGLAIMIGFGMLAGTIRLAGLLVDVQDGAVAPERLAPILSTGFVLGQWSLSAGPAPRDIPIESLGLLAAGQAAYLIGKASRHFGQGRAS